MDYVRVCDRFKYAPMFILITNMVNYFFKINNYECSRRLFGWDY